MSKRNSTASTSNRDIVKFAAFWGMSLAALFYIFSGIISLILKLINSIDGKTAGILSNIVTIFTLLGNIAIIVAIAIPAWRYVSHKSKGRKIFYWIMLVVFAFGCILGMLGGIL